MTTGDSDRVPLEYETPEGSIGEGPEHRVEAIIFVCGILIAVVGGMVLLVRYVIVNLF